MTGIGKSSLLHVLVTSLALTYPPDELELYLIDFKEGVEFKEYATHRLPHARVIAIESEREFGLSVLQGLDAELSWRGELFRRAGCNSLPEYRALAPDHPVRREAGKLPRILLLVDEFQVFFTPDDTIAMQAAHLLDRLVRQGRSFGVHVLLGSQSLSGAVSQLRSTMGQMSVRIAMKCTDADSQLILSEDNPAATLLKNQGEAFYNAMGGLREGNIRFQVAWIPDRERSEYLRQIAALAVGTPWGQRQPIVFEGRELPALEGREDHALSHLLTQPEPPAPARAVTAWLGEPVALKDPVTMRFSRQRGRNLLVVARDEEAARGLVTTTLVSLAAQYRPGAVSFYLADLSLTGAEDDAFVEAVRGNLGHPVHILTNRKLSETILALHELVNTRIKEERLSDPAVYLAVFGLHRARDLRRDETAYYRSSDAPLSASEALVTVLKDGPEVGVHLIGWAESMVALQPYVDHRLLVEFGARVGMLMTDTESTTLFNSVAAAGLRHRQALYYDDDRGGSLEKFRPYAPPTRLWMDWVGQQLQRRG